MQVPQADISQSKRVGVDEQVIKFRSSSNFKGMKKFIRSKIDKTETSTHLSPNNLPDPPPPPNLEAPVKNKPDLQPALDTLESTSDAPPNIKVTNNPDVEHEGFRSPTDVEKPESFPQQEEVKRAENVEEAGKSPESTIMCRDFIRGTCKRPGTCKYAHKCDKTQLFGVYTFCRNFQNKVCTLPNCKYVHASVFEEQEFYRSGKLPPHVLAPKCMPPPPPPPPPPGKPGQSENRLEIPTSFNNPPPLLPPRVQSTPSSMYACLPTSSVSEPRIFQEEFGVASGVRDSYDEPPRKKCKNCDAMNLRARCHSDLVEKKREAVEEYKRKTNDMEIKKERMRSTLLGLMKLTRSSPQSTRSIFNTVESDNKSLLDQLIKFNPSNRLSVGSGEDCTTGLLGENFGIAAMLANLISENQSHAEASRRE